MEKSDHSLNPHIPANDWGIYLRLTRIILAHVFLFSVSLFVSFTVYNTHNSQAIPVGPNHRYKNIQQALDIVSDGATILVSSDAPEEEIDLEGKNVTIVYNMDIKMGGWFWGWPTLFPVFIRWLFITLLVKLLVFGFFHQYQGLWRYVSVSDLLSIIKASNVSAVILVGGWYVCCNIAAVNAHMGMLKQVPVAVMLMDWPASIVFICGARLAIRLYFEETHRIPEGRLKRLLIVGAGNAGEVLLREIQRKPVLRYEVVGYLDDDHRKLGTRIHGVPVLGNASQIREIAQKLNADEVVIAMPSASRKELRRVVEHCEGAKLQVSMVPDLVAIASGEVSVSQMRDVDINDLLGRDPVILDLDMISKFIKDKIIMITGAGGSIGSEMCRQVGQFHPKTLLLIEQSENSLFYIERELRKLFPKINICAHICDIVDKPRVGYIFEQYRPDVVIHAAAHKHVPLMETNPGEAVKNNVVGTKNVAYAAHKNQASHFVMISTDKAVNPTSIMGSSKRLAEMIIQALNEESQTHFITVRFGNVLGSNGSVIPIFRQQIANGGPVTVTHPEMQRYFMTIPEASQLVLQAATMGRGGEVYVLDMGEPVKIVDLARNIITLSGFSPGEDIEITFTGMRPGEKLFEELAITGEDMLSTRHPKIGIWKNNPADKKTLDENLVKLLQVVDIEKNHHLIVDIIKELVPEYVGDVDCMKLHEEHVAKAEHNNHFESR